MMKQFIWRFLTVALIALSLGGAVTAQSFSCSFGKQAACLDYGDKVCGSLGKCVDESAACFNSYQCNYEGFTCKSNVTEIVEKYDALVGKYNSLVSDYDDLLDRAKKVAASYDEVKSCLLYADDLDEAKLCGSY